jgi:hypothetical protein
MGSAGVLVASKRSEEGSPAAFGVSPKASYQFSQITGTLLGTTINGPSRDRDEKAG